MRVLLDTHALIWSVADPGRLPEGLRARIADPGTDVLVSTASAWEIAVKVSLGRLEFQAVDAELLERFRFRLHPMALRHTTHLLKLPLHHRDPFDRMIVAQAQQDQLPVATRDPAFSQYEVDVMWS